MQSNFEVGDVVMLKSGGESMTVEGYTNDQIPKVQCVWFEKSKIQRNSFIEATLEKYEPMMPFSV